MPLPKVDIGATCPNANESQQRVSSPEGLTLGWDVCFSLWEVIFSAPAMCISMTSILPLSTVSCAEMLDGSGSKRHGLCVHVSCAEQQPHGRQGERSIDRENRYRSIRCPGQLALKPPFDRHSTGRTCDSGPCVGNPSGGSCSSTCPSAREPRSPRPNRNIELSLHFCRPRKNHATKSALNAHPGGWAALRARRHPGVLRSAHAEITSAQFPYLTATGSEPNSTNAGAGEFAPRKRPMRRSWGGVGSTPT